MNCELLVLGSDCQTFLNAMFKSISQIYCDLRQ